MSDDSVLSIDEQVSIPRTELTYQASRSGGPGGQHVNTSSTRVELVWDVRSSPSLTEEQRQRVMMKLRRRLDKEGMLRLASSASRSQHQNKEDVTTRFRLLLEEALRQPKPRRKTRPPRAAQESRIREKKRRSEIKRRRDRPPTDE